MKERILAFVAALREARVGVSQSELIDAFEGIQLVDMFDRGIFYSVLRSTLIKDPEHFEVFGRLFEIFFPLAPTGNLSIEVSKDLLEPAFDATEGSDGDVSEKVRDELLEALLSGDEARIRAAIGRAVEAFAAIEPGRPVGGVYYSYRTIRQLDLESLASYLLSSMSGVQDLSQLGMDSLRRSVDEKIVKVRKEVDAEVLRRLVADRGPTAIARTMAYKLSEDVDFVSANKEEMRSMQLAMMLLARKLASRLAKKHTGRTPSALDFRKTMREALSYGGTPANLYFRSPRISKPDVILLCDVSGSVASFARFTMQMLYAMSSSFSKVRSFAFVDEVDEVTQYFRADREIGDSLRDVATKARVVGLDGHSDYGNVFEMFEQRYMDAVTKRTHVIVCGDARSNYHEVNGDAMGRIAERAKDLYWLNPEPKAYWNSGDSLMSRYAPFCDGVFECRTLRQLQEFISTGI